MCAWNRHYCWPGTCGEELTQNCRCAEGFRLDLAADQSGVTDSGSTKCQPTKQPTILDCTTIFYIPNGQRKQFMSNTFSTACEHQQDVFGNFKPINIEFKMASDFTVKTINFTRPRYITAEKFGITDTTLYVEKTSVSGKNLFCLRPFLSLPI